MGEIKPKPKQPQGFRLYFQYLLIGAALGAYYGIFYRNPGRPIDISPVFLLSVLAALVSTVFLSWKKKKTFREILVEFIKSFALFFLFLAMLELRPVMEKLGGKAAVIIFTTLVGAIVGLIMGTTRKPVPPSAKKRESK
jgi:glycerol uptake facilitator-like aquaporin